MDIGTIIWAADNAAHYNHLHVEGPHKHVGHIDGRGEQPPAGNPGPTPGLALIMAAMETRFPDISDMGVYNRRPIAGSTRWSQHAWANAIDYGPYYGMAEQQQYHDYLQHLKGVAVDGISPAIDIGDVPIVGPIIEGVASVSPGLEAARKAGVIALGVVAGIIGLVIIISEIRLPALGKIKRLVA